MGIVDTVGFSPRSHVTGTTTCGVSGNRACGYVGLPPGIMGIVDTGGGGVISQSRPVHHVRRGVSGNRACGDHGDVRLAPVIMWIVDTGGCSPRSLVTGTATCGVSGNWARGDVGLAPGIMGIVDTGWRRGGGVSPRIYVLPGVACQATGPVVM